MVDQAYHSDLWIAVAAAAPVIALANTVAISSMSRGRYERYATRWVGTRSKLKLLRLRLAWSWAFWLSILNYVLQITLFSQALSSLANEKDTASPSNIADWATIGLVIILVVAFQAWRDWWEDFKADHYAQIKREDSGEISLGPARPL
jgi:hypothetical protein